MSDKSDPSEIPIAKFYGPQSGLVKFISTKNVNRRIVEPYRPRNILLAPSSTWKIFKKQDEVLKFVKVRQNGLMAYAFQQSTGERLFLAAHPIAFWHYDCNRPLIERNSYEIIPEYSPCKLYFDLEFSVLLNPEKNGYKMIDTFMFIVAHFFNKYWGIECTKNDVICLDSSSSQKFSSHLIYCLDLIAFKDNYNVGSFVKHVCHEIETIVKGCVNTETVSSDKLFRYCDMTDIQDLFVSVDKASPNDMKIFCDRSVYSKNRHFRLYLSSKVWKNTPLQLSVNNVYKPKGSCESKDFQLFLDSLITYLPYKVDTLKILHFNWEESMTSQPNHCENSCFVAVNRSVVSKPTKKRIQCPPIDVFITELVSPGRIYRSLYFSKTNCFVYDIVGYRYCGNIGRQHHSNNIKFVVEANKGLYHQKCHDPDCWGYRSADVSLPSELVMILSSNGKLHADFCEQHFQQELEEFGLLETDLAELTDVIEGSALIPEYSALF